MRIATLLVATGMLAACATEVGAPADLVEDELVLAVPVVAVDPASDAVEREWAADEEEVAKTSPFAALASLKKN